MKLLCLLLLLVTQEPPAAFTPPCQATARSGERLEIIWEVTDPGEVSYWRLTRQSSELGAEIVVNTSARYSYGITFTMPTGYTKRYWLRVRPVLTLANGTEEVGPASEECIVTRVK